MHDFPLISTLAVGFTAAWVFGILTQKLRLSPIVGYLLAGVLVGSHTPGFEADLDIAHQLAEVGVILLMFGVGLHFHLEDLLAVKAVAIPGAVGQSVVATVLGVVVFSWFGMDHITGAVLGMAMAVASTVVLMRVLMDAEVLNTPQGHVAVGWLLVEDVLTVIVLVLIPVLGQAEGGEVATGLMANPLIAIGWALTKLAAMVVIILVAGSKVVPWALVKVAQLRSRELFTLTVLVFSIAIAAGAYVMFGASMALGAFLAGMVVAQSPVSHQAAADALPLRDAFAVIFFVSVGMIFDPMILLKEPLLMLAAMGIIMIAKPLAALLIVALLGHSVRTSLTVALGLAQIGEFSFILSDLAGKYGLMTEEGHSVLVGGAILSITLNPILFRSLGSIENWLRQQPRLWRFLNARAERRVKEANNVSMAQIATYGDDSNKLAIVIGYGPVGRAVDRLLRDAEMDTVIIDMNMDTITELHDKRRIAIFGDASREAILEQAGVKRATHLVLTLPMATGRTAIVAVARNLNPKVRILVRAHYLREREYLEQAGATAAVFEEGEAAVALARLVLADTGASKESVEFAVRDIRTRLLLENVSNLQTQMVRGIMVPWTRVRRISSSATIDEVRRQVAEHHFSRYPIVDSATARTSTYLLAKDLVSEGTHSPDWQRLARPLAAVSANTDIETALEHFQLEGTSVCLVEDNGSPVGLVTIEDILEQVVGRIEDEYPREPKIFLQEAIMAGGVVLDLHGSTPHQVIAQLAANIPHGLLPLGTDVAHLALERERELPTCLGCGVAIPHARVPGLTRPLVVFGRSEEGILFNPDSSEIVRLVFLLVTPEDQPDVQVMLLSQLAALAGSSENRDKLEHATSAPEVMEIFAGANREEVVS
ncbi:MAG: cation:proton antiporter [Bythopirellula sp.]|nr:cation:proton antiporter [Bythopirellula sp.]